MIVGSTLRERAVSLLGVLRKTPIVRLEEANVNLFAKLEFCNAVGSLKDRPALWILKGAIERGEIDEGTTVVESSSGNFALALAVYCRMLGLSFVPVIDPNISRMNEQTLRALCEEVILVEERDDTGGFLKTRLAQVRSLCASRPRTYWPNQYENCDGMWAHYHTTGREICEALPQCDFVFLGVSSAGTIAGVSRRIKEQLPSVKVIAVDAEGSLIFGGPPRRRLIPGIGASVAPALLREAMIDDVVIVSERETVGACQLLLERHGLFVGGSTGSVFAAILRYFARQRGLHQPTALFLCADRGLPYMDTIYNPAWVSQFVER